MSDEFYKDGLCFECQPNCGACCDGAGDVYVDGTEISRLATHLQLPVSQFRRRFLRRVHGKYSLIDRPQGGCIFLSDDMKCTVYEARPRQCRTYPFWSRLLSSSLAWQMEGIRCPGIDKGEIIPAEEITRRREQS